MGHHPGSRYCSSMSRPSGALTQWFFVAMMPVFAACAPRALHPPPGVVTHQILQDQASFQSDGDDIRVAFYRPISSGRHPTAIVLHGGGGIHAIAPGSTNQYART